MKDFTKNKNTLQLLGQRFRRHSSLQAVCDTPNARVKGRVSVSKDIGRRLPLQPRCSYQGQQGDASQYVRGNYKTRFLGEQNMTAVEGNVFVYQVNPESRITGEGGAEC